MKFICLGYIDEAAFLSLTEAERMAKMEECFAYDDVLRAGGHFLGGYALGTVLKAKTVREQNGQVVAVDGPYAETKEHLGGILLLEARDLAHAVELMSKHPGARMGPFEIRENAVEIQELVDARSAQYKK